MLAPYYPHLTDLAHLGLTWGIALLLAFAGTGIAGRGVGVEYRIVVGWGGLCVALTLWGVLVPAGLRLPAIGFLAVAAATQLTRRGRLNREDCRALFRLLALSLPLWLVIAPIRPSQPDTFLNLLPNAMYLSDYGSLPTASGPPSFSFLPAAPYNTQFLAFLGAIADDSYPPGGMSLINVLLQLTGALAIARTLDPDRSRSGRAPSWCLTALGFLLATLLDPGFVPRINFSAFGETALAVTAVLAAALFARNQGELAAGRRATGLLPLALILAAMLNAKQSGIGLVGAVAGAAAIAGWAERIVPRATLARSVVLAVLPAVLLYALWRYYVAHAGVAELEPLPPGLWNWAVLPQTFASVGKIVAEKFVYFGVTFVALAVLPFGLRRWGWTTTTRLLALHAAAFVLYNGYLAAAYLAHFSPTMSEEAHSFFRYNTHLSLLLVLAVALAGRDALAGATATAALQRHGRLLGAGAIGLALLVPIVFISRLRFDLVMPQPLVWRLADLVKRYVEPGDRLALLLPGDNGSVDAMLSSILRDVAPRRRRLDLLHRNIAGDAALAEARRLGYRVALVSCTPERTAALFEQAGEGWRQIEAWPYPPVAGRWQHILAWEPLCRRP